MRMLCRLGRHRYLKRDETTEHSYKDKGAAIVKIREEYKHMKCEYCGKEKKELKTEKIDTRDGVEKIPQRKIVERKWKDE